MHNPFSLLCFTAMRPALQLPRRSPAGWGILMVAAGLLTWFTALVVVVRFIPHRIGPIFFRFVNAILGLILFGFATFCAIVLSRHFLH
jgi:hypothetical protein